MANWVQCTATPRGHAIWVNFDNATAVFRNDLNNTTQISFVGEKSTLTVKETPKELAAAGWKSG